MKKNKIIVYGDGGHSTSCIDLIESTNKFKIVGVVSNKKLKKINNSPIIGNDDDLEIKKYYK